MQTDNVALDTHSVFTFSETITPTSLGAGAVAEQSFTPSNSPRPLKSTDQISVTGPGTGNASGLLGARINATGQIVLSWTNPTAGALTPASGVFFFTVRG